MQEEVDRDALLNRVSLLTDAIASDPWDIGSLVQRGYCYKELGRLDEAVEDCSYAIRLGAEGASVYNLRGSCWAERGEIDKAIADFSRAIDVDPSPAPAYYYRGRAHLVAKRHMEAIADFTRAIELEVADELCGWAYYNRGVSLARLGQHSKAIADSNEAIQRMPRHGNSYLLRAKCWNAKHEFDKAVSDCTSALRINPASVDAYCERARSWAYLDRFDKSLADYTAAIQLKPCDASLFKGRGFVNEELGYYRQAIEDHAKAIEVDSGHIDSYVELSWILSTCPKRKYRDLAESKRLAEKACNLTFNEDSDSLAALAGAYAAMGDFGSAVAWQERALVNAKSEQSQTRAQHTLDAYKKGKMTW